MKVGFKHVREVSVRIFSVRWPFFLFLFPYLFFTISTYRDYGVAIDEPVMYRFGEML